MINMAFSLKSLRRVLRYQPSDSIFSRSYLHLRHFNYKTSSSLIGTDRDSHESENLLQISNLIVLKNERFLRGGCKITRRNFWSIWTYPLTNSSPSDLSTSSETVQTLDVFSGSRILSMRKINSARGASMTRYIRISRSDASFLPLF